MILPYHEPITKPITVPRGMLYSHWPDMGYGLVPEGKVGSVPSEPYGLRMVERWSQRKIRCWNQKVKECWGGNQDILAVEMWLRP